MPAMAVSGRICALALGIVLVVPVRLGAQSAHPEPGASFGDDYAPRPAFPQQTRAHGPAEPSPVDVQVLASGLHHPWSFAFLPDGRILIAERPGQMRILSEGRLSPPLTGLPPIKAIGTKGL